MIIEILAIVAAVASLVAFVMSVRVHVAVGRAERADAMISRATRNAIDERAETIAVNLEGPVRPGELVCLVRRPDQDAQETISARSAALEAISATIASSLERASPTCVCGHRSHEHMMDDGPCGNLRGGPCGCFRFTRLRDRASK